MGGAGSQVRKDYPRDFAVIDCKMRISRLNMEDPEQFRILREWFLETFGPPQDK